MNISPFQQEKKTQFPQSTGVRGSRATFVWVARAQLAVVSSVDSQKEQQGAREGDGACLGTAASEWALAQATEHPDATPRAAAATVCSPPHVCAAGSISTTAFGGLYVRQGRLESIEALCAAVGTRCSFAASWACSKKRLERHNNSWRRSTQKAARAGRGARRGCATGRIRLVLSDRERQRAAWREGSCP
jgi:hypothetical protein